MATSTAAQPPGLPLAFLPFIDMTTLSQSELRALSLCSSSSFDPHRTDDIVAPAIDHSIFNESAGSHRQTYSRLSSHHHHHRHRLVGLHPKTPNLPTSDPPPNYPSTDTDHLENHSIISSLKRLLSTHPEFQQLDLVDFDSFTHLNDAINFNSHPLSLSTVVEAPVVNGNFRIGERKRKRGRKPKVLSADGRERVMGMEIVNKNGVAVDLERLATMEDPYREELKRRTEGMNKEEELLGFFRDLEGQWCSRRRKRKIVDASEFGDTLPVGWKLLLGLKRKEGRAWVYCRRYLSPGGQQFLSCKEVSAYLQSFFGSYAAQQVKDHVGHNIQQVHRVASETVANAGATEKEEDHRQSNEHKKAVALLGIDNMELAEVQIRDLFECHKCEMTFDDKDTYLQHLLSFHQRTTRRYRLGSSVGDGVIVKDGKYECQFCHKVFHERRRYNGHVGIHVRNYVRGIEESPIDRMALQKNGNSPTKDELPTRISKMDALIEIAQNSIRETSSPGPNGGPSGEFTSDQQNPVTNEELLVSVSDYALKSDSSLGEPEIEYDLIDKSQELELQKSDHMSDRRMEMIDDAGNILDVEIDSSFANEQSGDAFKTLGVKDGVAVCTDEMDKYVIERARASECHSLAPVSAQKICGIDNNMNSVGIDKQDHCKTDEVDKIKSLDCEIGFGSNSIVENNIVQDTVQQSFKENGLQHGVPEPHASPLQPSDGFSAPNVSLDKGEKELSTMNQRQDKMIGFEELRLEDFEQLKFSFQTEQEPISFPEIPTKMENYTGMEGAFGASVQYESEVIDTNGGQLITVCVWCGMEFSHEAADIELQSDSVGYMCPTCKARISGQLDVLGGGCS